VDGFRVDAIPHLFEGPIDDRPEDETSAPTHLNETYEMVAEWRNLVDEKSREDNRTR
jgi:glycosidase